MSAQLLPFCRRSSARTPTLLLAVLLFALWPIRTALAQPPDVVVSSLTLTPGAARVGDPVTATVTVRNQGSGVAGSSLVGLYLGTSSGAPLTSAVPLGSLAVADLAPGAAQQLSVSFTVPSVAPGSFSVIAAADQAGALAENNETNNRRAATLQVTHTDLTVSGLTLAPWHARAGDTVTASVTVHNAGLVPANASTVRLYFEPGSGASSSTLVTMPVASLAARESRTLSLSFTVPAVPHGRWYYVWAQTDADAALPETNEGNNRRGAWLYVTIPDLTLTTLSVRPAPTRAGDPVNAVVVVRNSSQVPASASTLRVYFEPGAGAPARVLGSLPVGPLAPGQSQELSLPFTVPDLPHGRWYYVWAQTDADTTLLETNEGNNRRGTWLYVTIPDLTLTALSVRPAPTRAGDPVNAVVVVRNSSQVPASASTLRVYFEPGAGASTRVLGSLPVGPLAPGQSQELSLPFTVPDLPHGRWYYVWAQTDADTTLLETNEGNNRRGAWLYVTIPDLTLTTLSVRPAPTRAGDPVNAVVVVRNSSQVPASASTLRVYFEPGAGASTRVLGSLPVGPLAPGQSQELSLPFTVPDLPHGRWYYVWAQTDADTTLLETNEGNNRRGTWLYVTIPDLTLTALSVRPAPTRAGDPVNAVVVVRNSSQVPASASTLRVYFEPGAGAPARVLGSLRVGSLAPGQSQELSLPFTVPDLPHGRWYYVWAQTDPDASLPETNESNNRRGAWLQVTVPDLTLTSLSVAPTPTRAGDPVTVTLRIRNHGSVPADGSRTSLYVTTSSSSPLTGVAPVATVDVPILAPGKETQLVQAVNLPPLAAGYYHLVAVADSGAAVVEGNETNNRRTAGFEVAVPVITVDTLSVTPSLVSPGQAATASVRIVNRGRAWSRPTTADVFLATSELAELHEGVHVQTLAVNGLGPGASASFLVPVLVPVVDPGAHYVITQVDASTAVGGWTTMLVSTASGTSSPSRPRRSVKLRVSQPDLVAEALAVSRTEARPGQPLTVTFTVRNAGAVTVPASTAGVYLSGGPDSSLPEATPLGALAVPSLAAGASTRLTLATSLPAAEPGAAYVIVAADAGAAIAESIEANNRVSVGLQLLDNQSDLTVWVVDSLTRVQPTDAPGSAVGAWIKAARNESEAFQIVIRAPNGQALSNVNVVASSLVGPGGALAGPVRLYREHYVRVTSSTGGSPYPPGWWPDALIPFVHPETGQPLGARFQAAPFTVNAGQNQPVWVEVQVSRTAPAGTYEGHLTVTASGHAPFEVPVTLTVWNFTLPTRPSLQTWFGGLDVGDPVVAQRYLDELLRHGMSPLPPGNTTPRVRSDGSIDTSTSDAGLAAFLERASTWTIPWWPGGYPFGDMFGANRGRTQRYLYEMQEYLRSRGWLGRAVLFLYDEPDNPDKMYWAVEYARLVKSAAPDLRIMVTTPIRSEFYNLVNLWVPLFREQSQQLTQERQARGEEVWSYTAVTVNPAYPTWQLDHPLFHYRLPTWINWSTGLTGLLYWATNYWQESVDPWTDPTTYGTQNGEGALVYPGGAIGYSGPVASLRLKAIRDAVEDYEYLKILTALGDRASATTIAAGVGRTFTDWTRDPGAILDARERLGDRIHQLAR